MSTSNINISIIDKEIEEAWDAMFTQNCNQTVLMLKYATYKKKSLFLTNR